MAQTGTTIAPPATGQPCWHDAEHAAAALELREQRLARQRDGVQPEQAIGEFDCGLVGGAQRGPLLAEQAAFLAELARLSMFMGALSIAAGAGLALETIEAAESDVRELAAASVVALTGGGLVALGWHFL
jgi:hypothetical protein